MFTWWIFPKSFLRRIVSESGLAPLNGNICVLFVNSDSVWKPPWIKCHLFLHGIRAEFSTSRIAKSVSEKLCTEYAQILCGFQCGKAHGYWFGLCVLSTLKSALGTWPNNSAASSTEFWWSKNKLSTVLLERSEDVRAMYVSKHVNCTTRIVSAAVTQYYYIKLYWIYFGMKEFG